MRGNDQRLNALEERLMHQDRLLEELNEIVTTQQAQIEQLRREIARLKDQLAQAGTDDVDEPPPHY